LLTFSPAKFEALTGPAPRDGGLNQRNQIDSRKYIVGTRCSVAFVILVLKVLRGRKLLEPSSSCPWLFEDDDYFVFVSSERSAPSDLLKHRLLNCGLRIEKRGTGHLPYICSPVVTNYPAYSLTSSPWLLPEHIGSPSLRGVVSISLPPLRRLVTRPDLPTPFFFPPPPPGPPP